MVNKRKERYRDTDSCVRKPASFFYVRSISHYSFYRLCRTVYDRRILFYFTTFLKVLPFWRIT